MFGSVMRSMHLIAYILCTSLAACIQYRVISTAGVPSQYLGHRPAAAPVREPFNFRLRCVELMHRFNAFM
jgi:hypothetical protein